MSDLDTRPEEGETEPRGRGEGLFSREPWSHYAWTAGIVAGTLGLALVLRATLGLPDLEMLFLLSVMVTAVRFGRRQALFAAALGVGCYDFFFVPPFHTFSVQDQKYFLTFAMMFGVGIVISELTGRLRRQERRARQAALRARTEEMRSSLLSAVSHDLRTPLASITGAATSLRDDQNLSAETQRDLVESIVEQAERLERLVANLLDMTRLDSGKVALKQDWVPVDEMIGSALTRLEDRLGSRKVAVEIDEDVPLLLCDPVLFEQIFVNILENAVKYTPAGSSIEIRASAKRESVAIDILDHGPGIPSGMERKVFEKFVRGSHVGIAGAGLGLPICKGIVEAHGGTITAENKPGKGAAFHILVPNGGPPPSVNIPGGGAL